MPSGFIAFVACLATTTLGLRICFSDRAQQSTILLMTGVVLFAFGGLATVISIQHAVAYLVTPLRWSMTLLITGAVILLPPSQIQYEERRLTVRQRLGMAVFFTGVAGIVILFSYGLLPGSQTDYFSQSLFPLASCLS